MGFWSLVSCNKKACCRFHSEFMMWLKKPPMCLKKGEGLIILKVIRLEFKNLFTHKPFIIDYIHLVQTKYA